MHGERARECVCVLVCLVFRVYIVIVHTKHSFVSAARGFGGLCLANYPGFG